MSSNENNATPAKNTFQNAVELTVDKLLEVKKSVNTTSQAIELEGKTIIPVSKISVGFAGGGANISDKNKGRSKNPAGTGAGISETPMAFLVIDGDNVQILRVPPESKGAEAGTELLSKVVSLFKNKKKEKKQVQAKD